MKSGAGKIKKDHRDYSFKRTFGSATQLPDEYNCDANFGFPNQDADGLPYGCTGYTQSELCQDEDGTKYKPSYTYDKTLFMEGNAGQQVGCDIRDSLKTLIVYGAQAPNETTDKEAATHRRGRYFNAIDDFNNTDAFSDVQSALWLNRLERRSVSVGTPFWPEWVTIPESGMLPQPYDLDTNRASWHNWKISGWKTINGAPYLIGKPWCGPDYGDHGYFYIGRALFNQVMAINGTGAFTIAEARLADIEYIRLTILQLIVSYMRMLLAKLWSS